MATKQIDARLRKLEAKAKAKASAPQAEQMTLPEAVDWMLDGMRGGGLVFDAGAWCARARQQKRRPLPASGARDPAAPRLASLALFSCRWLPLVATYRFWLRWCKMFCRKMASRDAWSRRLPLACR